MAMMLLKDHIRQLREERSLLQKELAKKIGVSKATVSGWEQGVRSPNSTQRKKICALFGITESELFSGNPLGKNITPEILTALQDPIAVKALVSISKHTHEIKSAIKCLIECFPNLPPEKRQALLALCR